MHSEVKKLNFKTFLTKFFDIHNLCASFNAIENAQLHICIPILPLKAEGH